MASQEERDRIMAEFLASVQQDDDGDDDDEEAEFEPGDDDDDDEEDDEDDEVNEVEDDEDLTLLKGSLVYGEGKLIYKGKSSEGETFEIQSQPLHWDADSPTSTSPNMKDPPGMRTVTFTGKFLGSSKAKLDITFTRKKNEYVLGKSAGKSTGEVDDDNDDKGKMPSKSPAKKAPPENGKKIRTTSQFKFGVFGKGVDFEFYGELNSGPSLECHFKPIQKAPPVAAATAAASATDGDDYDDVENDADEGVDYDELIALHQDAGMPVAEVRKRYASTEGAAAKPPPAKRGKSVDDSDEEYGF